MERGEDVGGVLARVGEEDPASRVALGELGDVVDLELAEKKGRWRERECVFVVGVENKEERERAAAAIIAMVFFSRLFAAFGLDSIAPSFSPFSFFFPSHFDMGVLSSMSRMPQQQAESEKRLSKAKRRVLSSISISHLALDGDPGVPVAVVRRDVFHRQLAVLPRRGRRHGRTRLLDGRLLRVGVEEVGDDGVAEREEGRGRRRRRRKDFRRCRLGSSSSALLSEDGAGRRARRQGRDLAHGLCREPCVREEKKERERAEKTDAKGSKEKQKPVAFCVSNVRSRRSLSSTSTPSPLNLDLFFFLKLSNLLFTQSPKRVSAFVFPFF